MNIKLIAHLIADLAGDAYAPRLCYTFETSSDIHAISVDIEFVDDDVPDIDADTEDDALVLGKVGIPGHHAVLNGNRAHDSVGDAWKLDEYAVPGGLDDTTMVTSNRWVGQLSADRFNGSQGADLVRAHEAAVAHHICCEDRS